MTRSPAAHEHWTTRWSWLAGIAAVATASCGPKLVEDEKYLGAHYVRRRSVSDPSAAVVTETCAVVRGEPPRFPSPSVPTDPTSLATLAAKPGATIVYRDNLGLDYVETSSVGEPLPDTDEFWCGFPEQGGSGLPGLDCIATVDAQPAVSVQKVELLYPYSYPDSPNVVLASGFRATLTVLGPGKVTLGVPDTCPNGFPFSFTALVIEP